MSLGHGPSIPTSGLDLYLDIENPRSYQGSGTSVADLSNNRINHSLVGTAAPVTVGGVRCFDCSAYGRYMDRVDINYTVPGSYTMSSWAWLLPDAQVTNWRTLWKAGTGQHPLLIQDGTNLAGMWISGFRSFGYNVGSAGLESRWTMWTIAGEAGSTMLYVNGQETGPAIAFTAAGGVHRWIGANSGSQPWGYVSTAMLYGRRLSSAEIIQLFNATRGRYGI